MDMSISEITFKKPEFKKSYYLAQANKKIFHNIVDINIRKLSILQNKKGYILYVYLNQEDAGFFDSCDDAAKQSLLKNNKQWFARDSNKDNDANDANNLTKDDIDSLFKPSLCYQNRAINLFLSNDDDNVRVKINNKDASIIDLMSIISTPSYRKHYTLNIQVHHNGMYIYQHQTMNKWSISDVIVHAMCEEEEDRGHGADGRTLGDIVHVEDLKDIEEFWRQMLDESDAILESQIIRIQQTRNKLLGLYQDIVNEKKSKKEWESKIQQFKMLVQNIIF